MDEETRVRYPFFSLRYRNFIRLQGAIIGALLVAAAAFFVEARTHSFWWFANAWWILLVVAALEGVESWLLLHRARAKASESNTGESQ
jgi:lysylphosphatidylglycerol synthetase-like protein (DUF2156 family)